MSTNYVLAIFDEGIDHLLSSISVRHLLQNAITILIAKDPKKFGSVTDWLRALTPDPCEVKDPHEGKNRRCVFLCNACIDFDVPCFVSLSSIKQGLKCIICQHDRRDCNLVKYRGFRPAGTSCPWVVSAQDLRWVIPRPGTTQDMIEWSLYLHLSLLSIFPSSLGSSFSISS